MFMKREYGHFAKKQQGATLLEVVTTVTILGILIVTLGGLLRAITVGGRNMPTVSGSILTQQQVLDHINTFLVRFSRDVRKATGVITEDFGRKIILGNIVYEFRQRTGEVVRKEGNIEKVVLRGIYPDDGEIFKKNSDGSITVTLPVKYFSQTEMGEEAIESRKLSFVVQRRVSQ